MAEDVKEKSVFPLGDVVAERRFTLYEKSGVGRQVIVKTRKPIPATHLADASEDYHFRCPLSITGLRLDGRVFPPSGEDSLMASAVRFADADGAKPGKEQGSGVERDT